ncbi:Phospholipase D alpha 4 [Nymphaea thermarum]|nr:Phospholipase D alpha 4 [Nymphaea thermarum]
MNNNGLNDSPDTVNKPAPVMVIMDAGYEGLHPKDYLNFFCLANRELEGEGENYIPPSSPSPFFDYWNSQKNRRFTIYVHSKLMIGM